MRRGCIYALCEPNSEIVRYVGQTIKSSKTRYDEHLNAAKRGDSRMRVHRWIAILPAPPRLIVLEVLDEIGLDNAERRWIRFYRAMGADLLNDTDGGARSGAFRGPHTPEARMKIGAALRGRTFSPKTLEKMAAAQRGKRFSPEHRAKISAAMKGKPKPPEVHARMAAAQAARTGWKHTTETRVKMSSSQRARFARIARDTKQAS